MDNTLVNADALADSLFEALVTAKPEAVKDLHLALEAWRQTFPFSAARVSPLTRKLFTAIDEAVGL